MPVTATAEAVDHDRRCLSGVAAMGAIFAGTASLCPARPGIATTGDATRPFGVDVPEEALAGLRRRVAATRLCWENKLAFFDPKGVPVPVAASVFPDEIYAAPRSWTERAYPKLIHYDRLDRGGHFAAWEQPGLFTAELRAAFRPLRRST